MLEKLKCIIFILELFLLTFSNKLYNYESKKLD